MRETRTEHEPKRDLRTEFKVSGSLMTLARKDREATPSVEREQTLKDQVFAVLAAKAVVTCEALRTLCRKRFADDALCLLRTMVEAATNAQYVLIMGDDVAADYRDFPKYWNWIEHTQLRAISPKKDDEWSPAKVTRLKQEHNGVKSRYRKFRKGLWCKHTLFERARIVDQSSRNGLNLMQGVINTAWREASAYAHATMKSTHNVGYNTSLFGKIRPLSTNGDIADVLFCANFVMFALLEAVEIYIHGERSDAWMSLFREWADSTE